MDSTFGGAKNEVKPLIKLYNLDADTKSINLIIVIHVSTV